MPYVEEIAGRLKSFFGKEGIKAKVAAVGKLGKPEVAESVLEKGFSDFIMLGRPLLADAYWPQKVREGRVQEITHCVGDQEGCIQSFILGGHPCCALNPYTGFEDTKKLTKVEKVKTVAVIGGGPAGCEAARTAFLRGHKVTLFEKEDRLGGQLLLGSKLKIKHDLARYISNLQYQMKKLSGEGLEIKYNSLVKAEELKDKYDVIICSNGIKPFIPKLEGLGTIPYIDSREFLKNNMSIPEVVKKVTIVGGGVVGCETAYELAKERKLEVTIVEMLPVLMNEVTHANRSMLLWLMMGKGSTSDKSSDVLKNPVRAFTASKVVKFEQGKVYIKANKQRKNPYAPWITLVPENIHNPFDKKLNPNELDDIAIESDYVIFATGGSAGDSLYYELLKNNAAKEIYTVGDSRQVGRAWEAITAANDVARFI